MFLKTDKGDRIKTFDAAPEWNAFHKRYYVYGYRWIKTRQAWSQSAVLHNFVAYDEETP